MVSELCTVVTPHQRELLAKIISDYQKQIGDDDIESANDWLFLKNFLGTINHTNMGAD